MIAIAQMDTIGIGPNDGAWKDLSRDVAESLLRACSPPDAEQRSYTSVRILPTPSGQELYVRASLAV